MSACPLSSMKEDVLVLVLVSVCSSQALDQSH